MMVVLEYAVCVFDKSLFFVFCFGFGLVVDGVFGWMVVGDVRCEERDL